MSKRDFPQGTLVPLELPWWIRKNEVLYSVDLGSDILEDSLEVKLDNQEETAYDTNQYTAGLQKSVGDGRKQEPEDKYFELRYDPSWKNKKKGAQFLETRKASQVARGSSPEFSQDSFYLHPHGSPKEKQEEAKPQDTLSEHGTELPGFHEPRAMVSRKPSRLHTKGKEQAGDCHSKDNPSTRGINASNPPQRAKEDFVKKNKQTLGLRSGRKSSYLQLHDKKQEVQKKVTDLKTVDEELVQSENGAVKMEPGHTRNRKAQHFKEHQNKLSQKNKIQCDPNLLKGSDFPRDNSQEPPGRPAKPMQHHQLPPLRVAPMHAAKQDNSSMPQKRLYPHPPVCFNANKSENSDASLSKLPNSRYLGNQDLSAYAYPLYPTIREPNPAEMLSPAHTNEENEKHQRGFPNRLPPVCQCSCNPVTEQLSAIENGSNGHAHLNRWKTPSPYIVTFQEPVQDQGSLQSSKRCTYVDKMCQYSPVMSVCSPTPSHTTFPPTQTTEQHPQDIPRSPAPPSADKQVFSLLPPVLPPIRSASEVNLESSKGKQVAINQNNSEGFPLQKEKETPSKAGKKAHCLKPCTNLNMNLGGLGPDYATIKEKKEKLKQQKEYAKQVQNLNMKNMSVVQKVDTKPKVAPPTARQKEKKTASVLKVSSNGECQKGKSLKVGYFAHRGGFLQSPVKHLVLSTVKQRDQELGEWALEYAKKIPKPKNFKTKPLDGEMRKERVLPRTLNGERLPPIATLETLQRRHEKEKQVIAAFKKLDAL